MHEALGLSVPSIVVEGISTDGFGNMTYTPQPGRTVLYSGTLTGRYGIVDLIEAFKRLPDEDYRLIICGEGETEGRIREESTRDGRIIFKGLLSRDEVLALQKSATVLINPRPGGEDYTRYSFPSKMMEYMSSGTPVISYKLPGMPEEYFDYIYTIEDGPGEEMIYDALKEVLVKPDDELSIMGNRARQFVLTRKNATAQAGRITEMISSICEGQSLT